MIKTKTENILKRKPTWEIVKLSDVCEIGPSKRELNGIDKTVTVSFGMMADLGEHKRSFQPTETKTINALAKGGYSYFKEEDVQDKELEEMITYAGNPKYLLYGTDWPISSMESYLNFVNQLDLEQDKKELILWKNAADLFKIDVSKIV